MAMKIVALILATGIVTCAPALEDCSITGDYCRVTFKGQAVQPSFGSVAGIWFWSCGDAQLLLLGFEGKPGWKGVVCGAGWELNGEPLSKGNRILARPLVPVRAPFDAGPVKGSPPLAPAIADALVEWDWRLQDGIGTPREPRTFAEAVVPLRARFRKAGLGAPPKETADEAEWRALHQALRAHALKSLEGQKLFFGKFVPGRMSHQLTQCLGHRARPGGGLFVLDDPATMRPREVTPPNLPAGSFLNPELSPDATKMKSAPKDSMRSAIEKSKACPPRPLPIPTFTSEQAYRLRTCRRPSTRHSALKLADSQSGRTTSTVRLGWRRTVDDATNVPRRPRVTSSPSRTSRAVASRGMRALTPSRFAKSFQVGRRSPTRSSLR